MILIISGRPENVASFDAIDDVTVTQHVGWKLVGAVRVVTELGGVFHALVMDLGGARTALFWDRGSMRFAIAPLWGSKGDRDMHNVTCSCSECQVARLARPAEAPAAVAVAEQDLRSYLTNATDEVSEEFAALQLQVADLDDRLKNVEASLGRALARLGQLEIRAHHDL